MSLGLFSPPPLPPTSSAHTQTQPRSLCSSLQRRWRRWRRRRPHLLSCQSSNKKETSFTDQLLDYIEGGPKLRRWYGAPDLLPKDGGPESQEDESSEIEEVRDAVLVTDGESEIGQSMVGDMNDKSFLMKALRGVRAVICAAHDGFISQVADLAGVQHIVLLSQLAVYRGSSGLQAIMNSKQRKLAERDEEVVIASGIPYTIIRTGSLQNTPGGQQGFSFQEGVAAKGRISKEDAALICVEALEAVPPKGLFFEVVNGEEKVSDWKIWFEELIKRSEEI
ncbi:uncharacterized protein LOC109721887 isoform X2 [Ananas comosus]|uniref:Uncharacterized protein LOC109721887 isoform X2 n=1 Tax=Ananas comosus TaxID=4615 RepID=A0A6P5G9I3_ANACO|nr:uncharacterized protein LOC109721887 isoform X2 [Ananas comosus]